jgi:hypothetical protein
MSFVHPWRQLKLQSQESTMWPMTVYSADFNSHRSFSFWPT